jgi:hypothetical protein
MIGMKRLRYAGVALVGAAPFFVLAKGHRMNRLIEAVERRILTATDAVIPFDDRAPVTFQDGVLTVLGTPGDDRILVSRPDRSSRGRRCE